MWPFLASQNCRFLRHHAGCPRAIGTSQQLMKDRRTMRPHHGSWQPAWCLSTQPWVVDTSFRVPFLLPGHLYCHVWSLNLGILMLSLPPTHTDFTTDPTQLTHDPRCLCSFQKLHLAFYCLVLTSLPFLVSCSGRHQRTLPWQSMVFTLPKRRQDLHIPSIHSCPTSDQTL